MPGRTARCACGRVTVRVPNDPVVVGSCHCDFCQMRTGSVFQVCAYYQLEDVIEIVGDTTSYNGLEAEGVPSTAGNSVTYHFCPVCSSTVYWLIEGFLQAVPVGNFGEADFPGPAIELHTKGRHRWVPPVDGAQQYEGDFE